MALLEAERGERQSTGWATMAISGRLGWLARPRRARPVQAAGCITATLLGTFLNDSGVPVLLSNPAIQPGAYLGSITASTPEGDRYVHRSADVHVVREVGNKHGYVAIDDALDAVQRLGSKGQTLAVLGDYLSGDKLHVVETKAVAKLVGQPPTADRSILRLDDLGSDGLDKITSGDIGDVVLVHGQTAWDNVSGYDLLTSLENMYEV